MRSALLLFLLVALLPAAQGGLIGTHTYEERLTYAPGLRADATSFTFLSGALEADLTGATGPFGFFGAQGGTLSGIQQICFTDGANPPCRTSTAAAFTVRVSNGGGFAVDFPKADSRVDASHALGLFVDFANERDLQALKLEKSLVASAVGGLVSFPRIESVPTTAATVQMVSAASARIVALNPATTLTVSDGVFTRTLSGSNPLLFQGAALRMDPVTASTLVLPFESGATSTWTAATPAASEAGLKLSRLNTVIGDLNGASKNGGTPATFPVDGLGAIEPLAARIVNGALVRVPAQAATPAAALAGLSLVRLSTLTVGADEAGLAATGDASLEIQGGRVQEVEPLYGFSYVQLPWWSYLLWGLAIAAFIVRLALHKRLPKPKETRWHRLRWIGFIAGPLAFLLLFVLWDLEVQAAWGTSLLAGLAGGMEKEAFLALLAIEVAPFLLMLFAVASPLILLARSLFRIAKQGNFMGLSSAIGYLLAYPLGAILLLSYLDFALRQAAG
ncbi:MAG: hypothetical protein AABX89_01200 [Candidatus Thermoplasmatota archaeon]